MNEKEIENTYHSEQFELEILNKMKGVAMLLDGVEDSINIGNHIYHGHAIEVISSALCEIIKKATKHQMLVAELDNKIKDLKDMK